MSTIESILVVKNCMITGISFQEIIFSMQPSVTISRHLGLLTRPWLKQGNLKLSWNFKEN